MRHGAQRLLAAEIMRGRLGGVADEAGGLDLAPRAGGTHGGGIGHHLGHFQAGAMARIHGEEGDIGQIGAHGEGIEGGDAGRAQLHQQQRLEIGEMHEGAGHIHDRLTGADPPALVILEIDLELGVALGGDTAAANRAPGAAPK